MKTKEKLMKCLNSISDKEIREWTFNWLEEKTPSYFWEIAASSTGKYHPQYALGEGGVVRHTIVSYKIANDLMENVEPFRSWDQKDKDCVRSAILIHDSRKHGYPKKAKYSNASHGADLSYEIEKSCDEPFTDAIANLVASHMGRWNTAYNSKKIIAPKPKTNGERFVHLCDYLASRKYLEVEFKHLP